MGTIDGMDDDEDLHESEERSSVQDSEHEQFSTLEFEEYNGFSDEGTGEEMEKAERTQAIYEKETSPGGTSDMRESDDEVVYGRSPGIQKEEYMWEIPHSSSVDLFQKYRHKPQG